MKQKTETKIALDIAPMANDGFGRFPGRLYVIKVSLGLYAANNATLPDGSLVDGLACFPERDDATQYMALPAKRGIEGTISAKSFDQARQIAKSKQHLDSLLLFVGGKIVEYHYIR